MIPVVIVIVVVVIIIWLITPQVDNTYKAEFGNPWMYLSRFNHGFSVTGSKSVTKQAAHENCILLGPTGSGKTSTVILGSAFSLSRGESSICFNDVSGEIYEKTSGYLASIGYKILRLDFSNSACSETFNPLLQCKTTVADVQKIALIIILNAMGEAKGDPFWHTSSTMLLSLFIRYCVFHTTPEFCTLQNVLRLIQKFAIDAPAVDKLFVRTHDQGLLDEYKATVVTGDKTLQSIIASTRTALNLWLDKEVCKTTATNSIDFDILRKEKVALYVCNPLKDQIYFKPLSALFFQSLFNHVLSHIPNKTEKSVFFVLDEAASMRFPNLSVTISNIRKYRAGILLCMQDEMALISQYGQAEAHQIKTNCGCQIYLKGQPLHTCNELSRLLGKFTYVDEKGVQKVRELMTPDEIHLCNDAIILLSNFPPLRCRPKPIYENMTLNSRTKIAPYQQPQNTIADPPLLQFA